MSLLGPQQALCASVPRCGDPCLRELCRHGLWLCPAHPCAPTASRGARQGTQRLRKCLLMTDKYLRNPFATSASPESLLGPFRPGRPFPTRLPCILSTPVFGRDPSPLFRPTAKSRALRKCSLSARRMAVSGKPNGQHGKNRSGTFRVPGLGFFVLTLSKTVFQMFPDIPGGALILRPNQPSG